MEIYARMTVEINNILLSWAFATLSISNHAVQRQMWRHSNLDALQARKV